MDSLALRVDDLEGIGTVTLAELYEEDSENGGFVFKPKIDGMKPQSELDKLTEALRKERNDHRGLKTKYSALGDREVDDILSQLDEIEELRAKAESAGGTVDDEKIEQMVEQRLARIKAPLERELAKITGERDEAAQTNQQLQAELDDLHIGRVLGTLADKLCDPDHRRDVMDIGRMYLVRDPETKEVVTKDESPLPAEEWLKAQLDERPHWNKASGGGGGGKGNNSSTAMKDNPFSAKNVDWTGRVPRWNSNALAAQDRLRREQPETWQSIARAAGVDPDKPAGSLPPRPQGV